MRILLILSLFITTLCVHSQFTRQEAINEIVAEVVGADSLFNHHLFSKYSKMYDGDTLWKDGFYGYYLCPFQENWIFFVDDLPIALWAHPCRIIFFDASSGNFQVYQDSWPPHSYLSNYATFILEWEWILEINVVDNPFEITKDKLECYPNPFTENFTIAREAYIDEDLTIQIMNFEGKIVLEQMEFSSNSITVYAGYLQPGNYILLVSHAEHIIGLEKIVKKDGK